MRMASVSGEDQHPHLRARRLVSRRHNMPVRDALRFLHLCQMVGVLDGLCARW